MVRAGQTQDPASGTGALIWHTADGTHTTSTEPPADGTSPRTTNVFVVYFPSTAVSSRLQHDRKSKASTHIVPIGDEKYYTAKRLFYTKYIPVRFLRLLVDEFSPTKSQRPATIRCLPWKPRVDEPRPGVVDRCLRLRPARHFHQRPGKAPAPRSASTANTGATTTRSFLPAQCFCCGHQLRPRLSTGNRKGVFARIGFIER